MATLQKIRSYGAILIAVVGLALFAFIAEELVRALSYTRNAERQRIGEVYGEEVNYQEFNDLYDAYENAVKLSNGGQNLTDVQATQLRDQVWSEYVTEKIIGHEAEALGLTVTDAELQNIINTGASPLLRQTPFVNQQTGAFDVNMLKQFLTNYDEIMSNAEYPEAQKENMSVYYKYWKFMEKKVRQQALAQKYQTLLASSLISNPASAKAAYEARANEASVLLAAVPYTTIKDTDIEVSESDLKAKYKEMQKQYPDMFNMTQEARDIKYITVPINASKADEQNLMDELTELRTQLEDDAQVANTVRESRSLVAYNGMAVRTSALPSDIAAQVDSMSVGEIKGPYKFDNDNTLNVIRLINRVQQPDSVEYRILSVVGNDDQATKSADSILTALNGGANIDSIAKKYNQPAEAAWLTSAQIDNAPLTDDNRTLVNTILETPAGSYKKVTLGNANLIVKVTERRNTVEKVNVAVIKRTVDFSDETHAAIWNEFSSFLASNKTQADIEANAAKAGYTVQTSNFLTSDVHYVANTRSTTEALRWIFKKDTKIGDVSQLYECGNNNDMLMVVVLTGIHQKGDRDFNDENLKNLLTQEVIRDKKAAQLLEKIGGAKSVAEVAKLQGAVQDTVSHISFAAPTFVQKVSASEPALSGAVSAAKQGQFVTGVRGEGAVYAFQVLSKTKSDAIKYDQKTEEQQLAASYMRGLQGFMQVLAKAAKVVDNRYMFYQ